MSNQRKTFEKGFENIGDAISFLIRLRRKEGFDNHKIKIIFPFDPDEEKNNEKREEGSEINKSIYFNDLNESVIEYSLEDIMNNKYLEKGSDGSIGKGYSSGSVVSSDEFKPEAQKQEMRIYDLKLNEEENSKLLSCEPEFFENLKKEWNIELEKKEGKFSLATGPKDFPVEDIIINKLLNIQDKEKKLRRINIEFKNENREAPLSPILRREPENRNPFGLPLVGKRFKPPPSLLRSPEWELLLKSRFAPANIRIVQVGNEFFLNEETGGKKSIGESNLYKAYEEIKNWEFHTIREFNEKSNDNKKNVVKNCFNKYIKRFKCPELLESIKGLLICDWLLEEDHWGFEIMINPRELSPGSNSHKIIADIKNALRISYTTILIGNENLPQNFLKNSKRNIESLKIPLIIDIFYQGKTEEIGIFCEDKNLADFLDTDIFSELEKGSKYFTNTTVRIISFQTRIKAMEENLHSIRYEHSGGFQHKVLSSTLMEITIRDFQNIMKLLTIALVGTKKNEKANNKIEFKHFEKKPNFDQDEKRKILNFEENSDKKYKSDTSAEVSASVLFSRLKNLSLQKLDPELLWKHANQHFYWRILKEDNEITEFIRKILKASGVNESAIRISIFTNLEMVQEFLRKFNPLVCRLACYTPFDSNFLEEGKASSGLSPWHQKGFQNFFQRLDSFDELMKYKDLIFLIEGHDVCFPFLKISY